MSAEAGISKIDITCKLLDADLFSAGTIRIDVQVGNLDENERALLYAMLLGLAAWVEPSGLVCNMPGHAKGYELHRAAQQTREEKT